MISAGYRGDPLTDILHITDPHLFADPTGELRGAVTYATFERVLRHAGASADTPDLVLLTGDLVQDDSAEAYDHFERFLASFGAPVMSLPGNHDIRDFMRPRFSTAPFSYCEVRETDNWCIVCLDSCVSGSAGGRVGESELSRLDDALESTDAEHAVVCLHHPPVLTGSAWLDSVGLDDRDRFLDVIADHRIVRAVVAGHVHQEIDRQVDRSGRSFRVIATPSTCRQFKPLSRRFAVDNLPPAYRRIGLKEDGSIDTRVVWVDG